MNKWKPLALELRTSNARLSSRVTDLSTSNAQLLSRVDTLESNNDHLHDMIEQAAEQALTDKQITIPVKSSSDPLSWSSSMQFHKYVATRLGKVALAKTILHYHWQNSPQLRLTDENSIKD